MGAAAKEWCLWEMGTSKLIPDSAYIDKADNLDFAAAFSRIECHYFVNGIFVEEAHILKNAAKLPTYQCISCRDAMMWSALPHLPGNFTRQCLTVSWFLCLTQDPLWGRWELQRCLLVSLTSTSEVSVNRDLAYIQLLMIINS